MDSGSVRATWRPPRGRRLLRAAPPRARRMGGRAMRSRPGQLLARPPAGSRPRLRSAPRARAEGGGRGGEEAGDAGRRRERGGARVRGQERVRERARRWGRSRRASASALLGGRRGRVGAVGAASGGAGPYRAAAAGRQGTPTPAWPPEPGVPRPRRPSPAKPPGAARPALQVARSRMRVTDRKFPRTGAKWKGEDPSPHRQGPRREPRCWAEPGGWRLVQRCGRAHVPTVVRSPRSAGGYWARLRPGSRTGAGAPAGEKARQELLVPGRP